MLAQKPEQANKKRPRFSAAAPGRSAPGFSAPSDRVDSDPPAKSAKALRRRLAALEAEHRALRESEGRCRNLLEVSDDWFWEVSPGARYAQVSPRCRELLGYEPAELLRRSAFDFMPRDEARRLKKLFTAHAARRKPFRRLEHLLRRKDGCLVVLESSGVPVFDPPGCFQGYRGLSRDITERKQAEEALRASEAKFRQVIDASPVPLSVDNMRGRIEYLNQKFVEKFGYSHAEVPTSADWFARAYPNPDYRRRIAEEWRACLERGLSAGTEVGPLEVEVTCKDGAVRRVEFVGTFLGSRLLIAANDLTERKRLEKQILEISEQEQERIGQDLHDSLCQLLSGVKFKATLLEQKLQPKAPAEARDARAIEGLLNSAIQQARNMARGLHPVDLEARGLMSALEELAASVSNVYDVACVCQSRKLVLVHDHLVATHLYRIAQEAINNAIKHGQATKIWINLAARNERLRLTIRDNGRGLPPKPRKRKTGLGLLLMHYRSRTIGASLDIQSQPRTGTTVTCRLRNTAALNGGRT